jgi:sigma-E factor negative regulatory protein RseA
MLTQPAGNRVSTPDLAHSAPLTGDATVADAESPPLAAPAVPQWLSGNMASQFTQKAAFDSSGDEGAAATYLPRSTPRQLHRARAASAPEGNGYMLLIRPDGSRYVQPVAAPQAR